MITGEVSLWPCVQTMKEKLRKTWARAIVVAESFRGQSWKAWSAEQCEFRDCDFSDMSIADMSFGVGRSPTRYQGCKFDKSIYRTISGTFARFTDCSFLDVNLEDVQFRVTSFVRCKFSGRIVNVAFWGSVPPTLSRYYGQQRNDFVDNDFSQSAFCGSAFKGGIDLARQRLPSGPDFVVLRADDQARNTLAEESAKWSASDRSFAEMILSILEGEASLGQDRVFLRGDDVIHSSHEYSAWNQVIALTRQNR
jgi:uncharacterized protein YjbI with pentapeptide repeats